MNEKQAKIADEMRQEYETDGRGGCLFMIIYFTGLLACIAAAIYKLWS